MNITNTRPWWGDADFNDRHGSFCSAGGQNFWSSNDRSHSALPPPRVALSPQAAQGLADHRTFSFASVVYGQPHGNPAAAQSGLEPPGGAGPYRAPEWRSHRGNGQPHSNPIDQSGPFPWGLPASATCCPPLPGGRGCISLRLPLG